ncbi:hypothetical protein V2J09_018210 [Rumex salicifolius]
MAFAPNSASKMQGAVGSFLLHGSTIKNAVLRHVSLASPLLRPALFSRFESTKPARIEEHGFESTTISDVLKAKGKDADGSWLWCTTDDTVYDAVQSMTHHHVGALVVVKPGEQKSLAGIITERDYLRKIIVQGRSSKSTKVGDIMTEENKLITVSPDTKVLKAMQLMTDNRIRHIPVINDKGMIGMVSIGDVVRAVVSEHREELDRLNAFIQGGCKATNVAHNEQYKAFALRIMTEGNDIELGGGATLEENDIVSVNNKVEEAQGENDKVDGKVEDAND